MTDYNTSHYGMSKSEKNKELERKGLTSRQIQSFLRGEIGRMKFTVGHSMKGKPRKTPWGMHIERG